MSVIIPARNEEQDLETAMRSVLAQNGVDLDIVLVNDHSVDNTAAIADRLAAADPRVRVIHDPPLPGGWLGKANAMHAGLVHSREDLIVFTDADVFHDPDCFAAAVQTFRDQGLDFLSLVPTFRCESFWENILLPHILIAGTVQFLTQGVHNPRSSRGAAAGAFMMTRRQTLREIGDLEPIKSEVLDDVALATTMKRSGKVTRLLMTDDMLSVRLFKGNRQAFWGLTKNILAGVDHLVMAIPAMFLPVVVYWIPIAAFVAGLLQRDWSLVVAGLGPWIIQAGLLGLVGPLCRIRLGKALFFPLAAIPVAACLSRALVLRVFRNSVEWRGRRVRLGP